VSKAAFGSTSVLRLHVSVHRSGTGWGSFAAAAPRLNCFGLLRTILIDFR